MAVIHHGSSLTEGATVATYKVGTGGRTVRTFTGKEADIIAKAAELQAAGYETEITTGAVYKLTATLTVDIISNPDEVEPEPVPKWELVPHNFEQSIFECGRPFVAGLPTNVRTGIEAKLKNPQKFTLDFVEYNPSTMTETQYHTLQNAAARIYHYKQMGVDGRQVHALSLKRSIEVSTRYNLTWTTTNAEKVLSTGVVIGNADVPANIQTLMPSSGDATETVFVDGYFADSAGEMEIPFYYGWLEQWPTVQTVGSDRVQISQEWIYNKWLVGDDGLYDVVT